MGKWYATQLEPSSLRQHNTPHFSDQVHEGFAYSALKLYDYFKKNIAKSLPHDATFSVIGHSLGGAVAVLFAVLLRNDKDFHYKVKSVITFGQPMVCVCVLSSFLTPRDIHTLSR